jgi:hypothetical protein
MPRYSPFSSRSLATPTQRLTIAVGRWLIELDGLDAEVALEVCDEP